MNKALSKGIIRILVINIINLLFNLISNFVIPKYLSVDTYADLKTYQLYVNYLGLLHLGFIDSLYLKYGGKKYEEINSDTFKKEIAVFRAFQGIVSILILLFAIFIRDYILVFVALSLLPYNMFGGFKILYQAIGEFKAYSRIMGMNTIALFCVNMSLIFVVKTDNYAIYLLGNLIIDVLLWGALETYNAKIIGKSSVVQFFLFDVRIFVQNVKNGILLMLGNFISLLLTGIDRCFVKLLLTNLDFAQYSFAVSIENFINFAVTPVTSTLYNYFCYPHENSEFSRIKKYILMFSSLIIACAFPAKFILEHYLFSYVDATKVVFLLFASQLFFIVIKSIYVNAYKAEKRQKVYFVKMSAVIIVGIILNVICYIIMGTKEAFALGTLLSAVIWYILCQPDFAHFKMTVKENIYVFIVLLCFLYSGFMLNSVAGLLVYITAVLLLDFLFMKEELFILYGMIYKKVKNVLSKKA